ncbi:MAG TPA: sulfatase-like hydrolase/transferase [Candidatus Eisenbergiella intestinipullorum]|nr:sulfatase-like hydrolase/transferase [Candidatus Eisenbergiella intestinipullorum]
MKPNFLVFVTDQHRADWLSCMGNTILRTPHIDDIAKQGVMFEQAYCNTPLCMPSRATMWTGLPSSVHSARTNGVDLDDKYPVLPQILHDNGYYTASIGKIHLKAWHMSPERGNKNITEYDPKLLPECETVWNEEKCTKLPEGMWGLDSIHFLGGHGNYCFGEYMQWLKKEYPEEYTALRTKKSSRQTTGKEDNYYSTLPLEHHYNEWIAEHTIEELANIPEDKPFFIWCSFPDPHFPFGPPEPYCNSYRPEDMPDPIAWDDDRKEMNELYHAEYYKKRGETSIDGGPCEYNLEQIRETKALAWGMVQHVDDCIGKVMNYLEHSGKRENTVVIFLADHGELMGDHGMYCKGPFHYDGLLHIPLIMSWPGHFQEKAKTGALVSILDFMPTILDLAKISYPSGPVKPWEGPFEGKVLYPGSPLPGKSLVPLLTGRKDRVQESILVEDDDDIRGVFLRTLITEEYKITVYSDRIYGELFDRREDREERHNLWNADDKKEVKQEMIWKLMQKMLALQDRTSRRIGIA